MTNLTLPTEAEMNAFLIALPTMPVAAIETFLQRTEMPAGLYFTPWAGEEDSEPLNRRVYRLGEMAIALSGTLIVEIDEPFGGVQDQDQDQYDYQYDYQDEDDDQADDQQDIDRKYSVLIPTLKEFCYLKLISY